MEAIYRLAWLREPSGLIPVNWRDMETEELGSVYEGLLELTPRLTADGRGFAFAEIGEAKGNERKKTGSYYTPDSLVQALLDSALNPVLDRVEAEVDDPADALLSVTVIDPACGSGHFLLSAARRIATRVARHRTGGIASAEDYRHALREVVRACIHGVDRNPLAVELTKVALWIETVDPGKPLGFLDVNIRCGDSLLGVFDLNALRQGIPDAAYKSLTGDDKETARYFDKRNKTERAGQGSLDFVIGGGQLPAAAPLVEAARNLRAMPEDSPDEIAQKRRRFEDGRTDLGLWALQIAADLYTASFLTRKTGGAPANRNTVTIPTTSQVWDALAGRTIYGPLVGRAQDLTAQAHTFHWPLEFPDVMIVGGFDVVLGNPPWERIKFQEQEFFAAREPQIANAPNAAARGPLISRLKGAGPGTRERALYEEFESAKRTAEASSVFARVPEEDCGRFPLTGRGDVNTYALFAELFSSLTNPRGRAGVIVPTGIAHADTNKHFFNAIVQSKRLVSLFGFYEVRYWFVETDDKNSFCLLTIGPTEVDPVFVFDARPIQDLSDDRRRFTLSADDIARINPNTRTAPVFRSKDDAELSGKIYARVPVLTDEAKGVAGNLWGFDFATKLFDMADDSGIFRPAARLRAEGFSREGADWVKAASRYVPLYEAKMIHQFDHRWATCSGTDSREATEAEKQNPDFETTPRYWVPEAEVADRLRAKGWSRGWLMGWRDITRNSDVRTVIATAFPRAGVGHTLRLMSVDKSAAFAVAFLAGSATLTLDFVARQKVGGTHLTVEMWRQLPLLPPTTFGERALAFIIPRALELLYTSHAMAPFARDLRYEGPPFAWDEGRRALLRAELDAWYARAYGLTRDELRYILDPADVKGPDYPSETFRVLKNNEIARYGEYRTPRLVLSAWDAQELLPAAAQ